MSEQQPDRVLKLCGGDFELANFLTGIDELDVDRSGAIASRALLAEFHGYGAGSTVAPTAGTWSPAGSARDWGRKFLPANGGCAYIDLDHLELCLPEVRSAVDHVASWHAMLSLARSAMQAVNGRLPDGRRVHVHANNSDGLSQSYGGHLNVLVSRRAWDCIFREKLHYLLQLASFLASAVVFGGQGKVGSENARAPVAYQLSQRADFLESVVGEQTTFRRPIVNARDEPLTGSRAADGESAGRLARFHVISLDTTLCHVACVLKVGTLQIVLAMVEAGEPVSHDLILDDPVGAVSRWSHDVTLTHRERTVTGRAVTIVEHQQMFRDAAAACVEQHELARYVPGVDEILDVWTDTLGKLRERDEDALARRLDWALKRSFLERAVSRSSGLTWGSPQLKHLDHLYSSLDPSVGLYWLADRGGLVDRVVSAARIEELTRQAPTDTRAWTRAMVLREAGDRVEYVNWDEIRVRDTGPWPEASRIRLPDPLGYTRDWFDKLVEDSGHRRAAIEWLCEPAGSFSSH